MATNLGISSGWSSPYIAKLTSDDSPIPLNHHQSSWVTSIFNIGRFLGSFLGAVFANYLGCKKTLLIALFPLAGWWSCTIVADSPEWLYVGRFLGGIALGMTYSSYPLYLGEVSLPEVRGGNGIVRSVWRHVWRHGSQYNRFKIFYGGHWNNISDTMLLFDFGIFLAARITASLVEM